MSDETTTENASQAAPFSPLHPDSLRLSRRIGGAWIAVVLFIGVLMWIGFWFGSDRDTGSMIGITVVIAVVVVLVFLVGWVYPKAAYRHASWRINANGLEIRRGVWWRHRIIVPHSRMQHSDIEQGPLQRLFSLATLVINTAGTEDASVQLSGLTLETAERLRDELMNGTWQSAETRA